MGALLLFYLLAGSLPCALRECLISIVSVFSLDERSRLCRSHSQRSVLSTDARSASVDSTGKKLANAAGVSAQGRGEGAIV